MQSSPTIHSCVESDRSNPEDAVRAVQTDRLVAFAVADGAGGVGGGAQAAQLVVEGFEREVRGLSATAAPEIWCEFLLGLDATIRRDAEAGESTAVLAVIGDDQIVGASVGDSEAWMVPAHGGYQVLTSDQRKARLGSGRADPVGFRATLTKSVIIAATDGLFHAAQADAICSVLRAAPTPQKLVSLARSPSGKLYDDVGIVIASIV